MLPKKRRLTKELFNKVMDVGSIQHSSFLSLKIYSLKDKNIQSCFSVVAAKKHFKTAVLRNRMRRRVYSVLESVFNGSIKGLIEVEPFYAIIMLKPTAAKLHSKELLKVIVDTCVNARIYKTQ